MVKHSSKKMKRLITKIQKLRNKYGFNSITDLYENCSPIRLVFDNSHSQITMFDTDYVEILSDTWGYLDIEWNELPKEVLEEILEAFEQTIIENKKYDSVQYYSNI